MVNELENQQHQQSKTRFFLRHNQKLGAFKEIGFIRSNLQNNINAIPNMMYSRLSNVLTHIEKKLLNGTELEKEIIANAELQKNQVSSAEETTITSKCNNNILKNENQLSGDSSKVSIPNSSVQTTIMTTTTSTIITTTTINHENNAQSLSPSHSPISSSDILSVHPSLEEASTTLSTFQGASNTPYEVKSKDPSHIKIHINNDGAHVHDLYSFLEEINKLLTIYLVTRKKTDQTTT